MKEILCKDQKGFTCQSQVSQFTFGWVLKRPQVWWQRAPGDVIAAPVAISPVLNAQSTIRCIPLQAEPENAVSTGIFQRQNLVLPQQSYLVTI